MNLPAEKKRRSSSREEERGVAPVAQKKSRSSSSAEEEESNNMELFVSSSVLRFSNVPLVSLPVGSRVGDLVQDVLTDHVSIMFC